MQSVEEHLKGIVPAGEQAVLGLVQGQLDKMNVHLDSAPLWDARSPALPAGPAPFLMALADGVAVGWNQSEIGRAHV